ncbi:SH3 domain-containing protein [Tropicimonas sp. S265A]|uniref:SH3 domain-containing protein n=1 Tax=Tropicimonas sp. S265A TaxID=3415134 RepID=UPI003C7EC46D
MHPFRRLLQALAAVRSRFLIGGLILALTSSIATAEVKPQPRPTPPATAATVINPVAPQTGPVTNLPLPRFVSMKAETGNVRRGPSLTHRIDWVFQHQNMPLMIVGEYGHWRRVVDREGAGGWMHYALLSGVRTVIVKHDLTPIHAKPTSTSQIRARAEAGAIVNLDGCRAGWCRVKQGRTRGWVEAGTLWGLDTDLGVQTRRADLR